MNHIRKQLLQAKRDLESQYEAPEQLIERLRDNGCSTEEIERGLLKVNRIQGVYDSVVTALKFLEE